MAKPVGSGDEQQNDGREFDLWARCESHQKVKKSRHHIRYEKPKKMVCEVEGYKSAEHTKMYGLTRDVERGVRMALDEGNGRRLYRLIRPLHSADFADLGCRTGASQLILL